jgi:uncharacterized protein (TIGR02594 family)
VTDPAWLVIARKYVGIAEIPGELTAPIIAGWLVGLKAWWHDDAVPWCGVFCAECMRESGLPLPQHWYRAKGWLEWGAVLGMPVVGCVVIYERRGGGHVGFVLGQDQVGNLMTLGGNQGDKVSIRPFTRDRVLGYRWPPGQQVVVTRLPVVNSDGQVSTQEG